MIVMLTIIIKTIWSNFCKISHNFDSIDYNLKQQNDKLECKDGEIYELNGDKYYLPFW